MGGLRVPASCRPRPQNTALTVQQTKTIIPMNPQRRRAVADIRSEPRPASNRNRWPASYWNAWPASSETARLHNIRKKSKHFGNTTCERFHILVRLDHLFASIFKAAL